MDLSSALTFAFAAADVLIELGDSFVIHLSVGACQAILGDSEAHLAGQDFRNFVSPADRTLFEGLIRRLRKGQRFQNRTVTLVKPDGTATAVSLNGFRLVTAGLRVAITVTILPKAGKRRAGDIPAEISRDDTTGLIAADEFAATLATRAQNQELGGDTLTLLELDGLSDTGDAATAEIMQKIGGVLRAYSVGDMAGRLDGNRFGLLHTGDDISVETIEEEITRAAGLDAGVLKMRSTSFNPAASAELSPEDSSRVLRFVVQNFAAGHSNVLDWSSASQAIEAMVAVTVTQMSEIHSLMSEHKIRVLYQPIVSLYTEEAHHYEALTRFDDRHTGDTIKFAENTGIINNLDLFICEQVLRALAAYEDQDECSVAINMSASSLESDIFMASFRRMMGEKKSLVKKVMIELTETTNIQDLERAANIIKTLRADGHQICLDDFGQGATSFHYIRAFDLDYLKIDGSYIDRLGLEPKNDAIVKALVDLGHRANMGVIAECIENQTQASALLALGCQFGQGYYFSKAIEHMNYRPKKRTRKLA